MVLYSFWKQRFYAFLLRRILGPYLDTESIQKLHNSINDISIQDGTYVFTNLKLNSNYITSCLFGSTNNDENEKNNADDHETINIDSKQQKQQQQQRSGFAIRSAIIHRLEIHLSIQEDNDNNQSNNESSSASGSTSSLAWRALQLGNNAEIGDGGGRTSLVAKIVLDGMTIELEPLPSNKYNIPKRTQQTQPSKEESSNSKTTTSPGVVEEEDASHEKKSSIISSYIDAALASLRLSVDIKNLLIRFNSGNTASSVVHTPTASNNRNDVTIQKESWVQVRIYSCSYNDINNNHQQHDNSSSNTGYRTKLHKALSFDDRLTVVTGDRVTTRTKDKEESRITSWMSPKQVKDHLTVVDDENVSMIAEISTFHDCISKQRHQISFRVVEYNDDDEKEENMGLSNDRKTKRIQNDIAIVLSQAINVLVDSSSLMQIQTVATAFTRKSPKNADDDCISRNDRDDGHNSQGNPNADIPMDDDSCYDDNTAIKNIATLDNNDDDWNDIQAIMVKRYQEARELAERQQMTGGILVPSIDRYTVDGTPEITYDAFFDASDGDGFSSSQYITSLRDSIMMVPTKHYNDDNAAPDWCHTKIRFHVKEGCFKLSFQPGTSRPDEYILLTFSDFNIASSISGRSCEHNMSIGHLDIEDSLLLFNDTDSSNRRMVEISSLLRFDSTYSETILQQYDDISGEDGNDDDDDTDGALIQSTPCISLTVKIRTTRQNTDNPKVGNMSHVDAGTVVMVRVTDIDLTLEPIELTCRSATISKFLALSPKPMANETASSSSRSAGRKIDCASTDLDDRRENDLEIFYVNLLTFVTTCDSIAVELSLPNNQCFLGWNSLYDRCGYNVKNNDSLATLSKSSSPSIGLLFDSVMVELKVDSDEGQICTASCHNVILYANAPTHNNGVTRFDILALCGRTEVNPCIPVSIELWRRNGNQKLTEHNDDSLTGGGEQENRGSLSVPNVLPISAFKARQDDDDYHHDDFTNTEGDDDNDSIRGDWSRSSFRLDNKYSNSNKTDDWRAHGADPQTNMKKNARDSDMVVTVSVSEVLSDLTIDEATILADMVSRLMSAKQENDLYHDTIEHFVDDDSGKGDSVQVRGEAPLLSSSEGSDKKIAVTISFDFVSIALHGEVPSSIGTRPHHICTKVSYCLNVDRFKAHAFFANKPSFRHGRILAHEVDFLEVSNLVRPVQSPINHSVQDRLFVLNERGRCHSGSFATPLLHRSHLFSPMSRTNPSILLDIVNLAPNIETIGQEQISHMNVYITIYDVTYRFNYDSLWLKRLQSFLGRDEQVVGESVEQKQKMSPDSVKSVTRVFLTMADCNVDYCSSQRFKTASRTILRVGDFRVSSNVANPRTAVQACNLALGDISVYLCNTRYPYSFENKHLLRSEAIMRPDEISLRPLGLSPDCDPSTVLRAMNYRTVLVLDSVNANIAVSRDRPKRSTDPFTFLSLKVGEVGIFACKDSFARFMATVSEISAELSAINDEAFEALRRKSIENRNESTEVEILVDSLASKETSNDEDESVDHPVYKPVKEIAKQKPSLIDLAGEDTRASFLLDGYDWTTIEVNKASACNIPDGEEQVSRWYQDNDSGDARHAYAETEEIGFLSGAGVDNLEQSNSKPFSGLRIRPHHFPLQPVSDPIGDGDMGIVKYASVGYHPQVQMRVLVLEFALKLVFFDGYDWPEFLPDTIGTGDYSSAFVIPEVNAKKVAHELSVVEVKIATNQLNEQHRHLERKAKLMGDLLNGPDDSQSPFSNIPLAEERSLKLKKQAELRRLGRNAAKYLQFGMSGITLRIDTLEDSREHRLASCMNFKANDFLVAETISSGRPVRMAGEWVNEQEHPRDTTEGMFMMKMVTWHPAQRITEENEMASDVVESTLKILPLRCMLDQRAIAFARAVLHSDEEKHEHNTTLPVGLHVVPPPLIRIFRMRSFKVKVNYVPQKVNSQALRDGSLVELVNLSPIDSMVLTLQAVEVMNEIGFGAVMSIVVSRWVQDICGTQITKFLTNARPFEPITQVSGAAVDMVVLPWDAFKNGRSVQKALRAGTKSFSQTLVSEAFTVTSRAAQFLAGNISRVALGDNVIPRRPHVPPKGMLEATPHAVASISRGLQTANYKIIIIPYREYRRTGAKGAVTSVLKGIPIAVAAPASGAAEALSFTLLGARNQLRPDIRKEEEAIQLKNHLFDK